MQITQRKMAIPLNLFYFINIFSFAFSGKFIFRTVFELINLL